jgi:DNA-binding NarL/FixJ family response regulator
MAKTDGTDTLREPHKFPQPSGVHDQVALPERNRRRHQSDRVRDITFSPTSAIGVTPRSRIVRTREPFVIQRIAEGCKNREIADSLGITEDAVKNDLRLIFDKLGVWNRVELALWYVAHVEMRSQRVSHPRECEI